MNPAPARKSRNPLVIVLWTNALLLGAILTVILSRGNSTAHAEQPPIGGGAGVFIMPGQLSFNNWGCYMIDVDRQTLCVYRYFPGQQALRLEAARSVKWDRQLANLNTFPEPGQIQALIKAQENARGNAPPSFQLVPAATEPAGPATAPDSPMDGKAVDPPRE